MQILGHHIISQTELDRRLAEAKVSGQNEQRELNSAITSHLLANSEAYRKIAEDALGKRIILTRPLMEKLISDSLEGKKTKL